MRFAVLLALGLSAATSAVAAPSPFKPGTVTLAVPSEFDNSLGIDFGPFTEALCAPDSRPKGSTGRIDCGTSVGDTKLDPIEGILENFAGTAERTTATFTVTSFEFSGLTPWQAPCGSFDLSVTLDSQAAQPASTLTLIPDGAAPHGSFSGFLAAAVRLRFEKTGGGRVVEIPAELEIPVGGPYALADLPPGGTPPRSNVVLLVRREGDAWASAISCASPPRRCPDTCLVASKKTVNALGPSPRVAGGRADGPQ